MLDSPFASEMGTLFTWLHRDWFWLRFHRVSHFQFLLCQHDLILAWFTKRHPADERLSNHLVFNVLSMAIKQPAETFRFCGQFSENLVTRWKISYEIPGQHSRTTY
jgi:hypothetical protein